MEAYHTQLSEQFNDVALRSMCWLLGHWLYYKHMFIISSLTCLNMEAYHANLNDEQFNDVALSSMCWLLGWGLG